MTRGVVYCAQGQKFVDEAMVSIRSSLPHNPIPHALFCDVPPEAQLENLQIYPQSPSGNAYADKIAAMIGSPFDQTLYLDTDTYVVGSIMELFELLERVDVAAAHAPGYRGYADNETPEAFYELNSGAVLYRRTPGVQRFFEDWQNTYASWQMTPPFPGAVLAKGLPDQPAMRRCLWRSGLSMAVLGPEYNYRTILPGFVTNPVKIIHGRCDQFPALAAHLNSIRGARCFPRLTQD